jgi:hypothetical protein
MFARTTPEVAVMIFTLLLVLTLGSLAFVIVGAVVGGNRRRHRGFPPSTDGGPETVYRRRTLREDESPA